MVHCNLSIDLEMCGRDKHEQEGENAAVRHPVGVNIILTNPVHKERNNSSVFVIRKKSSKFPLSYIFCLSVFPPYASCGNVGC
jgi:hypothetical protein